MAIKKIEKVILDADSFRTELELELRDYFDTIIDEKIQNEDSKAELLALLALLLSFKYPKSLTDSFFKIRKYYTDILDEAAERFEVNDQDRKLVQELIDVEIATVNSSIQGINTKVASSISAGLVVGSVAAISRKEIKSTISKVTTQISTKLERDLLGYISAIEIAKGSEKKTARFVYLGVKDNRNRPFCRYVLTHQESYTLDEINQLDSRPDVQLLPVIVYCGGFNCRHIWQLESE